MTNEQKQNERAKFDAMLENFVAMMRKSALANFEHNLESGSAELVPNAITSGMINAHGELNRWCIDVAIETAAKVLENVNCHKEAAKVRKF